MQNGPSSSSLLCVYLYNKTGIYCGIHNFSYLCSKDIDHLCLEQKCEKISLFFIIKFILYLIMCFYVKQL